MSNIKLKHSIAQLLRLPTIRFIKNNTIIMDIKFEHDSDNGWAAPGNDWANALRGLEFPIAYYELIKDGWKKI